MASTTNKFSLTRTQCAELIGLSSRQFDDVIKPLIPDDAKTGDRLTLRYDAKAVVIAIVKYRVSQVPKQPSEDPLMDVPGGNVAWIDEYRKWKAGREQIKFYEEHGESISIAELEPVIGQFAAEIRRTNENLQKRYGPESSDILNEGVDEALRNVTEFIGKIRAQPIAQVDAGAGGSVPDGPAPNNEGVCGTRDKAPQRRVRKPEVQG